MSKKQIDKSKSMQGQSSKLLTEMKPEDWLKLYVDSEVQKYTKKFGTVFSEDDIDKVCSKVSDLKLPEGADVYVSLMLLQPSIVEEEVIIDVVTSRMHGLILGEDMLVYLYSKFCETDGYDEQVAYIFKQSLQYTIPF